MKENNNMQTDMKQSFSSGFGFRTKALIKFPLLLMLSVIPFIIFMSVPALSKELGDGAKWGISMGVFLLDIIILSVLRIFYKEQIKIDMYPSAISMTWFWIAWYTLASIGYWRILVSLIFYFVMYVATLILTIGIVFYVQKRKVEKVMDELGETFVEGETNQFFEEIQKNMKNQQDDQTMGSVKENLDEILREQGIDIDSLDREFGTFFEEAEIKVEINIENESVKIEDFLDEEIIVPEETSNKNEGVDKETTIEDKKIIDQ